jgi:tetratricopeptide (TPR) repeat protein
MAAWMIYLITLLPILGITYGGNTAMADRFTYVPGLSISLLSALGLAFLLSKYSRSLPAAMCFSAATVIMLLTSCYLTVKQISHWQNDVALWSRAIDVKPHFSGRVYYQRGRSYAARGEYQKALTDINEAFTIATRKKIREMAPIFIERARILRQLGDIDGAIADYTSAISSDNSPSRSMYYFERSKLYEEIGRTDLAIEDFKRANGLK